MSSNNPLAEDRQPTHQDNIEVLVLPEPGQAIDRAERKVKVLRVKITKDLRVKDLKELLKAYGLPLSGKRDILVQRLRKYAQDPEQWSSQFIPARNHERGDISSRRATNSHAARRIIIQFGTKESRTEYASRKQGMEVFAVEPPPTDAVKEANSEWVRMVLKRHTVIQNQSTTGSAQQHPDAAVTQGGGDEQTIAQRSGSSSGLVANACSEHDGEVAGRARVGVGPEFPVAQHEKSHAITGFRRLERRVMDLDLSMKSELIEVKAQLTMMQRTMSAIGRSPAPLQTPADRARPAPTSNSSSAQTSLSPPRAALGSVSNCAALRDDDAPAEPTMSLLRSSASEVLVPRSAMSDPLTSSSSACNPNPSPETTIPSENLMIFELDGEEITFDKTAVPNPPPISFADDLSRLFREWNSSNLLMVSGHGIPIKHWNWFYGKRAQIKSHVWDVIRARWNKWKSLVEERERFPSDDAFWDAYSDSAGKHLNQQSILALLQDSRDVNNKRDAAAALKFFGGDLSRPEAYGYFIYKKGNVRSVVRKPEAIARKWRELLVDHPEVSAAYARSQHDHGDPSASTSSNPI